MVSSVVPTPVHCYDSQEFNYKPTNAQICVVYK